MLKAELRKIYKEKRSQLSLAQKDKMNDLLLIQFQQLPIPIPEFVLTYDPIERYNEVDPRLFIEFMEFRNPHLQVAYPVMYTQTDQNILKAILVDEDTIFETNAFGVAEPINGTELEPTEIDLIISPLLCFDTKGNRVGYGKGYYDQLFVTCRKDCLKIGVSFFDPVESINDVNEFDIPLDYCVTPERIYTFNQ